MHYNLPGAQLPFVWRRTRIDEIAISEDSQVLEDGYIYRTWKECMPEPSDLGDVMKSQSLS